MVPLSSQQFIKLLFEFGLFERTTLNLVQADSIHKIFCAKHPEDLAHLEFRHKNYLVGLQNLADDSRKTIQEAQVQMADPASLGEGGFDRGGAGAGSRTLRNNKQ